MDGLSVAASIIAVLQLTSKVISYLDDIKDAPRDRAQCAIEASNLSSLLTRLRYRLEEGTSTKEPWYASVRALGIENGPVDQYKLALEQLLAKITKKGGLKEGVHVLRWKFVKDDVEEIMARIEHLKTHVQMSLQMDHL